MVYNSISITQKRRLQRKRSIMKRYYVRKAMDDLVQCTKRMKKDGITLEQIETELDYRDRANDNRWDDNLFEYSTQELETIAYKLWSEN